MNIVRIVERKSGRNFADGQLMANRALVEMQVKGEGVDALVKDLKYDINVTNRYYGEITLSNVTKNIIALFAGEDNTDMVLPDALNNSKADNIITVFVRKQPSNIDCAFVSVYNVKTGIKSVSDVSIKVNVQ